MFCLFHSINRAVAGNVVEHPVDSLHLVDNAVHSGLEDIPRNLGRLGGHEVAGDDSAQDNGQAVGAVVAHDSDAVHVGEGGEILAQVLVHTCLMQLFSENVVRLPHDFSFVRCDFANDADRKAGAGEGLAVHQFTGNSQFQTDTAHFILEEHAQRFNGSLIEAEFTYYFDGKTTHVVMGFDHVTCLSVAALDHIRINSPLCQVTYFSFQFPGFVAEYAGEFLPDNGAFDLGFGRRSASEKALPGIDADELQVKAAPGSEYLLYLVSFIFAHETVVDKDAVQLIANSF